MRHAWGESIARRDQLFALLGQLRRDAEAAGQERMLSGFTELARALRARLREEEEVLFPAAEGVSRDHAVTDALRREHAPMRELLEEIERAIAGGEGRGLVGNLRELESALELHCRKTEYQLLPLLRGLSPQNLRPRRG